MKKKYFSFGLKGLFFALALSGTASLSAQTVLLNENFESGGTGTETGDDVRYYDPNMPEGWEVESTYMGPTTYYRWCNQYGSKYAPMMGQHAAFCDAYMGLSNPDDESAKGPKEERLLSPVLTLDNTYQLSFKWKAASVSALDNQEYTLDVRIVEEGQSAETAPTVWSFNNAEQLKESGVTVFPWAGWQIYTSLIDLSSYKDKKVRIAFVHKMLKEKANSVWIDDVKVEQFTPATTPLPKLTGTNPYYFGTVWVGSKNYSEAFTLENTGLNGLQITGIESSIADYSTTINPAEVNLDKHDQYQFNVIYAPTLTGGNGANQTITIHTNGGDIVLKVNGGKKALTGGQTFEGFENEFPPVGWTLEGDWSQSAYALEGDFSAYCSGAFSNDSAMLVSPRLDFSDGTPKTLSFTYFQQFESESGSTEPESDFFVQFSENGGKTWQTVFTAPTPEQQIVKKTIDLPSTGSTNCLVRFLYVNPEMGMDYVPETALTYLDEVVLPPLYGADNAPESTVAVAPANGASNVDNRDVTLSWKLVIFADSYKLYIGTDEAATNVLNGQNVGNVSSYTFDSYLEYGTTYYWKVVPTNSHGDAANVPVWSFSTMADQTVSEFPWAENFEGAFPPLGWRVIDQGYTDWDVTNIGAYEGSQAALSTAGGNGEEAILETPQIALPADEEYQISFYWGNQVAISLQKDETGLVENTTTKPDGIDAGYFEAKAEGETDWTQLAIISDKSNMYWVRERIQLNAYKGKKVSFRWRYACQDYMKGTGLSLDNIRIGSATAKLASFNVDGWNIGDQNYNWPINSGNIFTLINDGTETLTISGVAFDADNGFESNGLEAATSIEPGKGVTFNLAFKAKEAGKQIEEHMTVSFEGGYSVQFPLSVNVLPEDVMFYNFEQDTYGSLTPRDFTTVDVDRKASINMAMLDYEHYGEPFAFMVMNGRIADWRNINPRSGEQVLVAFGAETEKTDMEDWIISNPMTATEQSRFSFYAQNYEEDDEIGMAFGVHEASILVSTTPYDEKNLEASFVEELSARQITPDGDWHEFAADLSKYAGQTIYIAVRHTVNDGLAAFFDDFRFEHFSAFNTTPPSKVNTAETSEPAVYPNPATDVVYLTEDNATVTMTTLSGMIVKKETGVSQLNVADLASGVYLLTVETEAGRNTVRIVKQ